MQMNKRRNRNVWLIMSGCLLAAAALVFMYIQTSSPMPNRKNQIASAEDPVEAPANSTNDRRQKDPSEKTATLPSIPKYTPPESVEALYEEETAVAEQLLEDLPNATNSMALMGQVYHNHGNMDEATKWLERCLALNPTRADVYSALGEIVLLKGEYEKAGTLFHKALEISPRMRGVHNNLAHALMGYGKIEEAVVAIENGIKIFPKVSQSYWMLGQAYLQLKEYPKAKENYEAAIALQPDYGEAFYGLASTCARLGQTDQSRQYMETFKNLKSEHMKARADWITRSYDDLALAYQSAAWTFMEAGSIYNEHKSAGKAEQLWRKAAVLDPKNKECRMHLAMLCLSNSRQKEALQLSEQIRRIEPDKADTYLMTGIIYSRLKRFDDTEQAFGKAIELAPKHPEGYCRLASLYLGANLNLPKARALAETAVQLQPIASNYVTLCQARDRDGDFSGALLAIERAMTLDPENAKYRNIYAWMKTRK